MLQTNRNTSTLTGGLLQDKRHRCQNLKTKVTTCTEVI
jgi:hypothetical protein